MTLSRRSFALMTLAVPVGIATGFVATKSPAFGAQTDATPLASPMASPAATGGVMLEMVDIAFKPNTLTIPANSDATVSIKNSGVTTHTFVINDHKNDGKPNLNIKVEVASGATGTATINAPAGDYYFWCDIPGHEAAGMFGTLTVQ